VNNAGNPRDNCSGSARTIGHVIDTNLKGILVTHAARGMIQAPGGGSSTHQHSGIYGNKGPANYTVQGGLIGFTKSISKELASRNVW